MVELSFSVPTPTSWLAEPGMVDSLLNYGVEQAKKGEAEKAIEAFNQSLQTDPKNFLARYNRARSLFEANEVDEAIIELAKATKLKPDFIEAYNNQACAYLKKGRDDLAISELTKVIRLKLANMDTFLIRGVAYGWTGANKLAIADFSRALEIDQGSRRAYEAYYNRGCSYGMVGEIDLAIDDYTSASILNPSFAPAFYNLGVCHLDNEQYDLAITDFTNAVAINPNLSAAFYNRGIAYFDSDETDLAISDFTNAIRVDDSDPAPFFKRGVAWTRKREFRYALVDWARAVSLDKQQLEIISSALYYYFRNAAPADRREMLSAWISLEESVRVFESGRYKSKISSAVKHAKKETTGVAGGTETPAAKDLDREERWTLIGLPKIPPQVWKPRPRGRPANGIRYNDHLIAFIREVYGPILKGKAPTERQQVRSYIFNKDRSLYERIVDYERDNILPKDIYMPSDRSLTRKRIEKLQRVGLAGLEGPERKSVVAKARRLESQQKLKP